MRTSNSNNFVFLSLFPEAFPVLNIEYLKTLLKKNDYKISMVHVVRKPKGVIASPSLMFLSNKEKNMLIECLRKLNPTLIGISVYSYLFQSAKQLTNHIREELKIPVIWGGIHPTLCPEECIQVADMVCVGEGEEAILELAQKISEGKDITQIKNIWVRDRDKIFRNDLRPLIQDLDSLPFPELESEDTYFVCENSSYNPLKSNRIYTTTVSRGCPYNCSFCTEINLKEIYRQDNYRKRGVENIINELELVKAKKDFVWFSSAFFPCDKKWIYSFTEKYKKQINLPFSIQLHPLSITEEVLDLLSYAGLKILYVGLQSGSERINREIFNRPVSYNNLLKMSGILAKYKNLELYFDYIVDNPFEALADKKEAIKLLLKFKRLLKLKLSSLVFDPKTKITKMALENGVVSDCDLSVNTGLRVNFLRQIKRKKEEYYYLLLLDLLQKHKFLSSFIVSERLINFLINSYNFRKYSDIIYNFIYYTRYLIRLFLKSMWRLSHCFNFLSQNKI